jgi:hypothetical protein
MKENLKIEIEIIIKKIIKYFAYRLISCNRQQTLLNLHHLVCEAFFERLGKLRMKMKMKMKMKMEMEMEMNEKRGFEGKNHEN